MVLTHRRIAVIGSREFKNYAQLSRVVEGYIISPDDEIISGGAIGADSMAQRWAKENGHDISIKYPKYKVDGNPAGNFVRNKRIVAASDIVLAFYSKDRFQIGGTANSIEWAKKLGVAYEEFREEET
jgi:hypothetical protein